MEHIKHLPIIGERIVVHGMPQEAFVEAVLWDKETASWKIILNWGNYGKSRVWAHDENRIWFRLSTSN